MKTATLDFTKIVIGSLMVAVALIIIGATLWPSSPSVVERPLNVPQELVAAGDSPVNTEKAQKRDKTAGPKEEQLVISTEGTPTRDNLTIRIQIVNASHEPILWDKEFSVFLLWRVGDKTGNLGGLRPVETLNRIQQNEQSLVGRFVTVHPGEKLTKAVNLTRGFRYYRLETDVAGNNAGYEQMAKFIIPEEVKAVSVRCTYLGLQYYSNHVVSRMFGFLDRSIPLYPNVIESNRVVVQLEE